MSASFGKRSSGPGGLTRSAMPHANAAPVTSHTRSNQHSTHIQKVVRANAETVFASRFFAALIDLIIWSVIYVTAYYFVFVLPVGVENITETGNVTSSQTTLFNIASFAGALGCFMYGTLMEWRFGATVGKFITGTRVMTSDGETLSLLRCMIRNLSKLLSLAIPFCIAYWTMLFTEDSQTLHDIFSDTHVYKAEDVMKLPKGHDQEPGNTRGWARETVKSYAT